MNKQGGRLLQDPLSMRTMGVANGAVLLALEQLEAACTHFCNTCAPNPVVLEPSEQPHRPGLRLPHHVPRPALLTNPHFDPTGLRLSLDGCRLALAELATRSLARQVNLADPGHNGSLPVGLAPASSAALGAGPHNRNILVIAAASCSAVAAASRCQPLLPLRIADGVEDVGTGLCPSLCDALRAARHIGAVLTCELVVAWDARRCREAASDGPLPALPKELHSLLAQALPQKHLVDYVTDGQCFDLGACQREFLKASAHHGVLQRQGSLVGSSDSHVTKRCRIEANK